MNLKKPTHISVLQISFLKHKIEHKAIHTSQIHGIYDDLISREKTMLFAESQRVGNDFYGDEG